jgi:hypothetical protein
VTRAAAQVAAIHRCQRTTARRPGRHEREPRPKNGGLHVIEAAVHAELDVMVFAILSTVAQPPHLVGDDRVVGGHRAAIAQRAEILRRIETERRGRAERPDRPAAAGGEMSLARVLENREILAPRQVAQGHHVRRLPVQVHRHDRGGTRRHGGGRGGRIERQAVRIDVGKDRGRAGHHDAERGEGRGQR